MGSPSQDRSGFDLELSAKARARGFRIEQVDATVYERMCEVKGEHVQNHLFVHHQDRGAVDNMASRQIGLSTCRVKISGCGKQDAFPWSMTRTAV